jgi:hypothetical protein
MTELLFANEAAATLAGAITNTSTTVSLQTGEGALFPNPTGGQAFTATFTDAATGLLTEIVSCTARSGDVLTIVRAQEGTTALNWNPGDFFNQLWTAGQAAAMLQASQIPSSTIYFGVDAGLVNAMAATVSPVLSGLTTGDLFEIIPLYANTSATVTLNVSSLGAQNVFRADGSALQVGDIQAAPYTAQIVWNGTANKFLLQNPCIWVSGAAVVSTGMSGRLTLATGIPVMAAAYVGETTVYFSPINGNLAYLWNGTVFVPTAFAEINQALSDTTNSPAAAVSNSIYDYFLWLKAGVPTLSRGPAGGSTLTRGASGLLVNANSITNGPGAGYGTYVGRIATDTGAATVTFNPTPAAASGGPTGGAWVGVWNQFNRRPVELTVQDDKTQWTWGTEAWEKSDNSANNRCTIVVGQLEDWVSADFDCAGSSQGADPLYIGIAFNSVSAPATTSVASGASNQGGEPYAMHARFSGIPILGLNYLQAMEFGVTAGTPLFYGSGAPNGPGQTHMLTLSSYY